MLLFDSRARGDNRPGSDWDIFIEAHEWIPGDDESVVDH